MSNRRAQPKLNKRYVATHAGYDFYSVNAYAVRDIAQPDEEFGIFASREEFPDLIPENEIWIAEKTLDKEGIFFVADALTRLKEEGRGVDADRAYTAGLNVERLLRDALVFPLYDGGNMGVRRRQLHGILRREGYDQMLAAEGRVPPWTA